MLSRAIRFNAVKRTVSRLPKTAATYSTAASVEHATRFTAFNIPAQSYFGFGAIPKATDYIKDKNFKKVMIVTDSGIVKVGLADQVTKLCQERGIEVVLYDKCQPNPSIQNVNDGYAMWKETKADALISIGGGSAHDNAKAVALLATNGGEIKDYEGVNKSKLPQLPLIAINTTAGTASELTMFTIITDSARQTKMAIIDPNVTPALAVNDPQAMLGMPPGLTAATGLDALTHSVEAYVSSGATPITDACALMAIDLIVANLKRAYDNGKDLEARNNMCYAEYLAGMAFNNAGLGYVHAIAHQLGGVYHLPHGVCNAVLLSTIQKFNMADPAAAERLTTISKHFGCENPSAESAVKFIKDFAASMKIPKDLKTLGVNPKDFDLLATNAMKDACHATNPIIYTKEQVIEILKDAYE